jgi:hypothetical protein
VASSGKNDRKYDLLIDRMTRVFLDHDDARAIANHLRVRRNQTVHSRHNIGREALVILYQIEMLASQILFFCMENRAQFKNHNELCNFLDLSLDQKQLRRQQELTKYFIAYQNRAS